MWWLCRIGDYHYVWWWPPEGREGTGDPDQRGRLEGKGGSVKWATQKDCPLVGVRLLNISQMNLLQEKVKNSVWHY